MPLPRTCVLFALGVCDVMFFVALALACDTLTPVLAGSRTGVLVAVYVVAGITFLARAADYYRLFRDVCLYRRGGGNRIIATASASWAVVALYSVLTAALAMSTVGICQPPIPDMFTGTATV